MAKKLLCSHLMVRVVDLSAAVEDFRADGFRVQRPGGEAASRNALVWFDDGPTIELFVPPKGSGLLGLVIDLRYGRGAGRRLVRWSRTMGICDIVLATEGEDLQSRIADLFAGGVSFAAPVAFSRRGSDGNLVRFRCGYPRNDRLPFLMTPYDPPQARGETDHPNGARAVRVVDVEVAPADRAAFDLLTGADWRIRLRPGAITAVRSLEIEGLAVGPGSRAARHLGLAPAR
ncbi:hypothetical protein DMP23_20260 [Amycolatopsis sp. A1MSW2902]|uniref:VOC family protein n=1 Tax=Amycolatopsis sp. A1MSW2902 TaxID=687413 RepID=UPI00307EA2FF